MWLPEVEYKKADQARAHLLHQLEKVYQAKPFEHPPGRQLAYTFRVVPSLTKPIRAEWDQLFGPSLDPKGRPIQPARQTVSRKERPFASGAFASPAEYATHVGAAEDNEASEDEQLLSQRLVVKRKRSAASTCEDVTHGGPNVDGNCGNKAKTAKPLSTDLSAPELRRPCKEAAGVQQSGTKKVTVAHLKNVVGTIADDSGESDGDDSIDGGHKTTPEASSKTDDASADAGTGVIGDALRAGEAGEWLSGEGLLKICKERGYWPDGEPVGRGYPSLYLEPEHAVSIGVGDKDAEGRVGGGRLDPPPSRNDYINFGVRSKPPPRTPMSFDFGHCATAPCTRNSCTSGLRDKTSPYCSHY